MIVYVCEIAKREENRQKYIGSGELMTPQRMGKGSAGRNN